MDHDELIFRSLQGRTSDREERELRDWRDADPRNGDRYQGFAAVWRVTREYEDQVTSAPPAPGIVASLAATDNRVHGRWKRVLWPAVAAAAAFVVGLGVAGVGGGGDPVAPMPAPEVVTGIGETTTARLPDGTLVRLAPESRLVLSMPPDAREVGLDGQAFFAVSRDPERPFLVRTPSGDARVLGTRFELAARVGQLRLLVVEGEVSVGSEGAEVAVGARQMTHLRTGEQPATVEVEDVWPLLGWMGDFLAFESTPLHEVQWELERRFDVTLVFEDPALAEETVTAWFRSEPIGEVVSVLCRIVEARCTVSGSEVRMTRGIRTP